MSEYLGHNCLSYVATMMDWSYEEKDGLPLNAPFYKNNLKLEKFLCLYAKHIGSSTVPNHTFGEQSNVITFTDSNKKLVHVAIIDSDYADDIYHRRGFNARIENIPIEESSYYKNGATLDYWSVPETEHFRGFLDEE